MTTPTDARRDAVAQALQDAYRNVGDLEHIPWLVFADAALSVAAAPELIEALKDMLSGWRYIRQRYGDLDGVGWDRAEQGAEIAIKKAEGRS